MKKINGFLVVFFLASCASEDLDLGPPMQLSAVVNNVMFQAATVAGYRDGNDAWMYGEDETGNLIDCTFAFDKLEAGKTFSLSGVELKYYDANGEVYTATEGSITVDVLSENRFEGSFSFEGKSFSNKTVTVEAGVAHVNLNPF